MTISRSRWRIWFSVGCVLAAVVVFFCLLPARDMPRLYISDKVEHASAYCLLSAWFGGLLAPRRYLLLAVALLVLGAVVELLQGVMHVGRQADVFDLAANAVGIVLGLVLSLLGLRRWVDWVEKWLAKS